MEQEIKKLYLSGLSSHDTAKRMNLNHSKVYSLLRGMGITRSISESLKTSNKLRKFNPYVFDRIGVVESYYLGLIFSDGCICETTNGRKMLTFVSMDFQLVSNIKIFMNSANAISERHENKKIYYSIAFCNGFLYERLLQLGCVAKKSLIIGAPKIDSKYYLSFLMGMFDGDGSISLNRSINSWKCSIGSGSKKMFLWISTILEQYGFSYSGGSRIIREKPFYTVELVGISALAFLRLLYDSVDSSVVPLERKHKRFLELSKVKFRKGPNFLEWEKEYLLSDLNYTDCCYMINNDSRNYGWVRKAASVRYWRNRHKETTW